jgi:hypothetical protein
MEARAKSSPNSVKRMPSSAGSVASSGPAGASPGRRRFQIAMADIFLAAFRSHHAVMPALGQIRENLATLIAFRLIFP